MLALPPGFDTSGDEHTTGLGCPDCPGVLTVRVEGANGHILFRCRIGHSYSLAELLLAKESEIEGHLFAAIVVLEEMAALLVDLQGAVQLRTLAPLDGAFRQREARARAQVSQLQEIVEKDRPIQLDDDLAHTMQPRGQ